MKKTLKISKTAKKVVKSVAKKVVKKVAKKVVKKGNGAKKAVKFMKKATGGRY